MGGTSGWTDSPDVYDTYPAIETHDLGPVAVVVPWLVMATTGWTVREDVREHLRWWRRGGPRPLNCVGLTAMALGLLGFDIDADTPDQLNAKTREAAARAGATHPSGAAPVA